MQVIFYFVFLLAALLIILPFNPIYAQTPAPSNLTWVSDTDTTITYTVNDSRGIAKVSVGYGQSIAGPNIPGFDKFFPSCPTSVTLTFPKTMFAVDTLQMHPIDDVRVVTCGSEISPGDDEVGVATWWEGIPPHEDEKPHIVETTFAVERLLEHGNYVIMMEELTDFVKLLLKLMMILSIIILIMAFIFFFWLLRRWRPDLWPFLDPRKWF